MHLLYALQIEDYVYHALMFTMRRAEDVLVPPLCRKCIRTGLASQRKVVAASAMPCCLTRHHMAFDCAGGRSAVGGDRR